MTHFRRGLNQGFSSKMLCHKFDHFKGMVDAAIEVEKNVKIEKFSKPKGYQLQILWVSQPEATP